MDGIAQIDWGGEIVKYLAFALFALVVTIIYRRLFPKSAQDKIDKWTEKPVEEVKPVGGHVPDQFMFSRTSKFARTESEINRILDLRAAHFGDDAPASGASFINSRAINDQLFKLIYRDGRVLGYWGVLPVTKADFQAFCAGKRTHEQMLSQTPISWQDAGAGDDLYLYFTGLVKLPETQGYSIVVDAFSFFYEVHQIKPVNGIACYAERDEGQKLIDHALLTAGFRETGAKLGVVSPRPVVASDTDGTAIFVEATRERLDGMRAHVPVWDHADRDLLFSRLQGQA